MNSFNIATLIIPFYIRITSYNVCYTKLLRIKFKQQLSYSAPLATAKSSDDSDLIEVEKLTQIRKTIAKNMIQSKHNAAHMTVFDDVDVAELIRLRNKFKERYVSEGIKLSYLPFILKATAIALKKHKMLNSEMDMENGTMRNNFV